MSHTPNYTTSYSKIQKWTIVKLLWCVFYSSKWRVLFIAVGGWWSDEVAGARHDRTYDSPPFIVDGPDAHS
jgi:hypothetical protein